MNSLHFVLVVLAAVVSSCLAQCNDEQLNKAKLRFKDCLEDKKAHLLQLDYEEDNDMQLLICSGLKVTNHISVHNIHHINLGVFNLSSC